MSDISTLGLFCAGLLLVLGARLFFGAALCRAETLAFAAALFGAGFLRADFFLEAAIFLTGFFCAFFFAVFFFDFAGFFLLAIRAVYHRGAIGRQEAERFAIKIITIKIRGA